VVPAVNLDRANAELRERCAVLEERVRQLEAKLGQGFSAPPSWKLSPMEERLFGLLLSRQGFVSTEAIYEVLYGGRVDDGPNEKIIATFVMKIRRKLPEGVAIETRWGRGFEIGAEARARLAEIGVRA
jgi:DNA-binding response OmpR family regulator